MKKILLFVLILTLFFSFSDCKKMKLGDEGAVENVTQYVKNSTYAFEKEEDLVKDAKDVKEKKLLEFGDKLTILKMKKIEEKDYYNIQLPDKTKYWVLKENITEKFIVINQNDVDTYKQPDQDSKTGIKLQPGDYGIFVKEQDGWINVEFYAYRPLKEGEDRKWVGNKWIKEGYTEDIKAAKESYYLYLAYYYKISKNDKNNAIKYVKFALDINKGDKSEIYSVLEDYLKELESSQ